MSPKPVIFLSAVSKELKSARTLVAKTVTFLGYEPDWEDIFGTGEGHLLAMLRRRIDASAGVVQIVGHCYGAEPSAPDETFGRVSYTQYEALYAHQRGKKVWYLFLDDGFTADPCDPEPEEKVQLQRAYRERVQAGADLYHPIKSSEALEASVLKLRDDLTRLRRGVKQWAALVLGLLLVICLGIVAMNRNFWRYLREMIETKQVVTETKKETKRIEEKVIVLHEDNAQLLQAMRDFPRIYSQRSITGAKEDEATQMARAYAMIEKRNQLPAGTLAKEMEKFALDYLRRTDTAALDRAHALFATKQFPEAETQALKATESAPAVPGQSLQEIIDAHELAGQSAEAQRDYPGALDHYRAAAALTSPQRDVIEWTRLQNQIGWLYFRLHRYPEQLILMQSVWQTGKQAGKGGDPSVLVAHQLYALALIFNDMSPEAETEFRAILALQRPLLGETHPDTLNSRMGLAAALAFQEDKIHEAETEYREVLATYDRMPGPSHPDTLICRRGLANARISRGEFKEAEKEYRELLPLVERTHGENHPDVFLTCFNLALCLEQNNKLKEAREFVRRAETGWANLLGADHAESKNAKRIRERIEAALKAK